MADCFNHPGRDATGACINCGKMICLECRTILGGKVYCQTCADEVFVKTPAKARAERVAAPAGVSGAWWLMPIFLIWIGGLIAWAVTRDKDRQKAWHFLWLGLLLTFVYLIITVVLIAKLVAPVIIS